MNEKIASRFPSGGLNEEQKRVSAEREEFLSSLKPGRLVKHPRRTHYPGADSYHPSVSMKTTVKPG